MVAISRGAWYNGSYTMAGKPIKSLELYYKIIQFLTIFIIQFYLTHGLVTVNNDGEKIQDHVDAMNLLRCSGI